MKPNRSDSPSGLLRDLQARVAEAEAMLATSETGRPDPALRSMRTRVVAARDRFAEAYARMGREVMAGAVSVLRRDR